MGSGKIGEYMFFLDFDGNKNEHKVKTLLEKIKRKTAQMKVFGNYLTS